MPESYEADILGRGPEPARLFDNSAVDVPHAVLVLDRQVATLVIPPVGKVPTEMSRIL